MAAVDFDGVAVSTSAFTASVQVGRVALSAFCIQATDRLLGQFHNKPIIEAWIESYCRELDEVRQVLLDLQVLRLLDNAFGVQLDGLGDIVGQKRGGKVDDVYRQFIRARILANRSNGEGDEIYAVLETFLPDGSVLRLDETPPASFTMHDETPGGFTSDPADVLFFLQLMKLGGVRVNFLFSLQDPSNTFTFSSQSGVKEASATQGWGNVAQTTGGHLAGVVG